ncbi:SWIM zinc finger family protein [Flagellimonas spongiicola]|uniref:SWIM zinc finger family protein n=1 Tax=Flagellimonas spongiicola TaxID=2942208 RepID=UPI003AAB368D
MLFLFLRHQNAKVFFETSTFLHTLFWDCSCPLQYRRIPCLHRYTRFYPMFYRHPWF